MLIPAQWGRGSPNGRVAGTTCEGVGGAFFLSRVFDELAGGWHPVENGEMTVFGMTQRTYAIHESYSRPNGLGGRAMRALADSAGDPGGEAR